MPRATFHFPPGFLWGTATASHQVEGNNTNNNWAEWEKRPGRILNGDTAGRACDWWAGRWRDDFDRAAEGRQNAHRMSIEWSRVQPAPDRWNEDALDVYRQMLRGLAQRGMTALVTLHHFTDPLWLTERGGWENDETPALFEAYTRRVVDALREYCSVWAPVNEPNLYAALGYLDAAGTWPPGKNDAGAAGRVLCNLVRGHGLAYRAIKSLQREARVGTAMHVRRMLPARAWLPFDALAARLVGGTLNAAFLDALVDGRLRFGARTLRVPEAAGTQDFVGLNYYSTDRVAFQPWNIRGLFHKRSYAAGVPVSDSGMIALEPEGLFEMIRWAQKYRRPVIITENGVDDANDRLRPRYIVEHVHQMWRAVQFNWQVKGYFHWTLVDNFEWERGWTQRFGLWGLDPGSQARARRPSADLYAAICKENALSYEMVEKWAPESLEKLFPG